MDISLVDRLQEYCCNKPASLALLTDYLTRPSFYLLSGHFARFDLVSRPMRLQVRSPIPSSDGRPHNFTTILLDGSILEVHLFHLIDVSYRLVFDEMDAHDQQIAVLMEQNLNFDEALDQLIQLNQLEHRTAEIRQLLMPAIVLRIKPADPSRLPVGTTKIGGLPDVPEDFVWPMCDGRPMAFLAQINLIVRWTRPAVNVAISASIAWRGLKPTRSTAKRSI